MPEQQTNIGIIRNEIRNTMNYLMTNNSIQNEINKSGKNLGGQEYVKYKVRKNIKKNYF
jgi:hypothetical protein